MIKTALKKQPTNRETSQDVKMQGGSVMRRGIKKVMKGDKFGAPSLNMETSRLIFFVLLLYISTFS